MASIISGKLPRDTDYWCGSHCIGRPLTAIFINYLNIGKYLKIKLFFFWSNTLIE